MATTDFTNNVTLTDAAWFDDVDKAAYAYLTSTAGTNTITATGPATFSYTAGAEVRLIAAGNNSGATTINITPSGGSALGAKNVYANGAACVGGELVSGRPYILIYDGTQFNIVGTASTTAASDTVAGVIEIAIQSEMETPSSATLAVTPLRMNFHPGVAKAWVKANVTGTVLASHNITSVTDDGTGLVTVTIATDFADANYDISPGAVLSTAVGYSLKLNSQAAGSFQLDGRNSGSGAALDPETWHASCFGDQA